VTTFTRIETREQIPAAVRLAHEIWSEHYTTIIGRAQVDYMLDRFQSEESIAAQLADGYEYYTISHEGELVGYIAIVPDDDACSMMISKLYVRCSQRGQGFGRAMLDLAKKRCRERNARSLWLTVNKNNSLAIAFYTRMGFRNAGSVVKDIGAGFVMDDYRMEKAVTEHIEGEWRRRT
jgi:ribosomal protein S18 acetylase RimI-like enzyme